MTGRPTGALNFVLVSEETAWLGSPSPILRITLLPQLIVKSCFSYRLRKDGYSNTGLTSC